jgi:hypothetical protein
VSKWVGSASALHSPTVNGAAEDMLTARARCGFGPNVHRHVAGLRLATPARRGSRAGWHGDCLGTVGNPDRRGATALSAKDAAEEFQDDVEHSALAGRKRKQVVELMAIDKNGQDGGEPEQLRPARMQIETTVLMSSNGESHPTELVDISATGALLRRPLGWSGHVGQSWVLDMIFGNNLHIHLEAVVARISDHHIGFSYSRIPEDKQVPLWNLLGGYADILEYWKDS